jgi:tetratricopeptide (TPR) repeat protein
MAADLESLCREGRQLFRQGKHARSIQVFQEALKLDPDRADVHEAIATAAFVLKQYDLAITHFTRATQLRPMDAKPYINLGAVHNRRGDYQAAAEALKKAISRDGKSVEAYYNLGIAYRGLHQPAMAVNAYKEALRINPRMLDAMLNLGNLYLEMNNPKYAIEQYRKALEINPDFAKAKQGLARAEDMQAQAKQNFSPFGRLVDTKAIEQAADKIKFKKMTPEERIGDRQTVRRLMIEAQALAQQLLEHARDVLENDVMQLNRSVQLSQRSVHKFLYEANENFQASCKKFEELRAELLRVTNAADAHESSLKATK